MKNIDTINKAISKSKNIPLDVVTKINDYYWNSVKLALRSVEHEFIHVKKIGTFEVSLYKINRQIVGIRDYIRNIRNSNKYNEATKEGIIRDYKERYRKCVAMKREVINTMNFLNTYREDE